MYTYKLQQEQPICAEKIKSFMILSVGGQKRKVDIEKMLKNSIAIEYGKKMNSWIC